MENISKFSGCSIKKVSKIGLAPPCHQSCYKFTLNPKFQSHVVYERPLDCYFRQFWTDNRLSFNSTSQLEELAMNWAFLNRIWRPDTFIVNGKDSYLHKMTVPNRFIRISPKGQIAYSQRLTLKAR